MVMLMVIKNGAVDGTSKAYFTNTVNVTIFCRI